MPSGDKTGPEGRGPMTGRALGYCAGYNSPGFTRVIPLGRGFGVGRGGGRGFGHGRRFWRRGYQYPFYEPGPMHPGIYPEPSKEEESSYLKNLVKSLEEELKAVQERLKELSREK